MHFRPLLLGSLLAVAPGCRSPVAELVSPHDRTPLRAGSGPSSWNIPAWFVDNSSTVLGSLSDGGTAPCASDSNNGQSSSCGPIGSLVGPTLTVGEVVSRLGTNSPALGAITSSITLLSDDNNEAIDFNPRFSGASDAGLLTQSFALNGTMLQTGTTTLGVFTPLTRQPAPGQTYLITASGQTGNYWTPFLYNVVHDVTADAWFTIEADLGTATARISTPFRNGFRSAPGFPTPAQVVLANGDSLVMMRQTKAHIASYIPNGGVPSSQTFLQNLWLTGNPNIPATRIMGIDAWVNVYVDPTVLLYGCPTGNGIIFNSVLNQFGGVVTATIIGGAIVAHSTSYGTCASQANMAFEGDVLIDTGNTRGIHIAPSVNFDFAWLNASLDGDACFGGAYALGTHDTGGGFYVPADGGPGAGLWGPAGFDMEDGCSFRCNAAPGVAGFGSCSQRLLLAGALSVSSSTTGQPYQADSGTWGAPVTITPAAIDDAGAICNVATNDCWRR